jgi:sigma-B regulation protein RsbU (phosphoserine phosphatase)
LSIRWKLIISIILPLLLIAGIVMGLTLRRVYDSAAATLKEQHLREVNLLARSIDNELLSLARIAEDTAAFLNIRDDLREQDLYALLSLNAGRNPLLYGAAMAFEPYAFRADLQLFSPYVYDSDLKQIDIGAVAYDYTDGNWEWYSAVKESGQALWTAPYFDTGAGNLAMTTYSHPMFRDGEFYGVTTVDLRLDELSREIASQLNNEKFMIVSPGGTFVSHYRPELALNSSLADFSAQQSSPQYQAVADSIMQGASGLGIVSGLFLDDALVPGNTWIFHTPIPSTGWMLATLHSESDLTQPLREQINIALLGLSLTILLIFVLVWLMSSRIARPIKKLEAAVSDVARGKLDTHIENIRSLDELGRLSIGFNRMLKNLKKQIDIQSQQEAAQKLLEREWQMARETQRSLLPTEFPAFPDRKEFELHAVNLAANHVAGDFFDFFLINPRTLMFVIADVSGKGMSAALVMAVTRTIVRDLAQSGKTPADILRETNERLRDSQKGAAFVTIFLGSYTISTGRIVYANGGHVPPFLITKNGTVTSVGEATGTIVGMLENQEYRNAELRLQHGETLLLYTDGFPEARSKSGEFFGTGRVRSFLQHHTGSSVTALCEAALREINAFQNQNLADDITLLALRRTAGTLGSFFLKI